jgi:bacterioferritin-associated ferredoxin
MHSVHPEDHVCMCYRVSLRKLRAYLKREDPAAPSQLSECLGAGTGCGWCVPFLEELHRQHKAGVEAPDIPGVDPVHYAELRTTYRQTGQRPSQTDS